MRIGQEGRGALVIVRAFGDRPLVRRVWEVDKETVYVTDDKHLKLLVGGKDAPMPIGFPKEDVFAYHPQLAEELDRLYRSKGLNWATIVTDRTGTSRRARRARTADSLKVPYFQHLDEIGSGPLPLEINLKPPKRGRKKSVRGNKC